MPATVQLRRWTGTAVSPTKTQVDGGSTRLNAADDPAPGTSNPVARPGSGSNYSYWAAFRLTCTAAPAVMINNVTWFTNGANNLGTGIACNVGTATAYTQATGTPGTSGLVLSQGNYPSLNAPPLSAFSYTQAAPLTVAGTTSVTGDFGDFVVMQMAVGPTASAGASGAPVFSWMRDEIA